MKRKLLKTLPFFTEDDLWIFWRIEIEERIDHLVSSV